MVDLWNKIKPWVVIVLACATTIFIAWSFLAKRPQVPVIDVHQVQNSALYKALQKDADDLKLSIAKHKEQAELAGMVIEELKAEVERAKGKVIVAKQTAQSKPGTTPPTEESFNAEAVALNEVVYAQDMLIKKQEEAIDTLRSTVGDYEVLVKDLEMQRDSAVDELSRVGKAHDELQKRYQSDMTKMLWKGRGQGALAGGLLGLVFGKIL